MCVVCFSLLCFVPRMFVSYVVCIDLLPSGVSHLVGDLFFFHQVVGVCFSLSSCDPLGFVNRVRLWFSLLGFWS